MRRFCFIAIFIVAVTSHLRGQQTLPLAEENPADAALLGEVAVDEVAADAVEADADAVAADEVDPAVAVDSLIEAADTDTPHDKIAAPNATSATAFARLIRIPLPIRGTIDTQVRRMLDQVLSDLPNTVERPIIVLEFAPPINGSGDSSEFGRALDLARFLASPRTVGVRTVAYLPETVKGHAVLVALACEEIIMHPDAQIGAAGISEDSIDATLLSGYREIADRRRTIPSAIALGMLDPQLQVQRLTTASGVRYALPAEVAELQQTANVQAIDTVIPAGEIGLLSGDKLRLDYNFVSHLANDRRELAAALNVPPSDLEIDPTFGGEWNAIHLRLDGPVTPMLVNRIQRGIDDALRKDAVNFVCLSISSPGGSIQQSVRLANYLSELDSTKLRTVAYVSDQAAADASVIALACDQLVMHSDAQLGGFGVVELDEDEIKIASLAIEAIMAGKSRTWTLPTAVINPELEVHRYQLAGSTVTDFFCAEELQQQDDPDRWTKQELISAAGKALKLSGSEAAELKLARYEVSGFEEMLQRYQLDEAPQLVKPNWAHELVAALATPQVAAGLLFIAFFAMLAEVSAPGISIGGFVSALCFLLFFWSNFLAGTAGWLEVVLFVAGLFFVAMELLVLPGFGIFGLGGAAMVLASLILASQTFVIPQNSQQNAQLLRSMYTVIGGIGGFVVGAYTLRNYLAHIPYFEKMMLPAVEGEAALAQQYRESIVHYDHLLDQRGRTTTPLTPSGKADFDGELIDVVSDGLAVDRGATVQVMEVAGNRVVVRECT